MLFPKPITCKTNVGCNMFAREKVVCVVQWLIEVHLFGIPRCRLRVLDSFGTEAEFNYGLYQGTVPGGRSDWANADLNLRQFFTMFRELL